MSAAQKTLSPRAWIELSLLALAWGASFLAFAIALQGVGFLTVAAHRVVWAAVLMWAIALVRGWPLPPRRFWMACGVMGVLNNALPFSLIAWGQLRVDSGLASIFNASTALFAILIAALVFADERLTRRKAIGAGLGFCGVIVAIGTDALRAFDVRSAAQLAIVGASVSYGFAAAWGRATLTGLDPRTAALGMLTASAVILGVVAPIVEGPPRLDLGPAVWGAIIYLAAVSTVMAYILYYRVLATAGAANLMLVTLLIPPIAILLGAIVLGERLSADAIGGFALIAAGMAILDGRVLRRLPFSKPVPQGIETPEALTDAGDEVSDKG